jgi:predicted transcriptional regulator of viral defense system
VIDRKTLSTIKALGVFRPADIEAVGLQRQRIYSLVKEGRVEKVSRGVYVSTHHPFTEHHSLALVARRVPRAVVCLLSALRFHGLTTQMPSDIWIALPEKARRPHLESMRLSVSRFSGHALTDGVETHVIEGVPVRITTPARTVADCFRYRNKIGIDVAIEALKDFTKHYRGGANDLARHAKARRVSRVMKPYMDAIA